MVSDYNVYASSYNQDSLHLHFCALLENGTFDKIQAIDNWVLHFGISKNNETTMEAPTTKGGTTKAPETTTKNNETTMEASTTKGGTTKAPETTTKNNETTMEAPTTKGGTTKAPETTTKSNETSTTKEVTTKPPETTTKMTPTTMTPGPPTPKPGSPDINKYTARNSTSDAVCLMITAGIWRKDII
jgi:hypothetical protein